MTIATLSLAACGGDEAAAPGSDAGPARTVEITLTDFRLEPATVTLHEPGTYTFRAVNDGATAHALEVEGEGVEAETEEIAPGASAELAVELDEGTYELYCPVGDHEGRGMKGGLSVGEHGGSPPATEDDSGSDYGY